MHVDDDEDDDDDDEEEEEDDDDLVITKISYDNNMLIRELVLCTNFQEQSSLLTHSGPLIENPNVTICYISVS